MKRLANRFAGRQCGPGRDLLASGANCDGQRWQFEGIRPATDTQQRWFFARCLCFSVCSFVVDGMAFVKSCWRVLLANALFPTQLLERSGAKPIRRSGVDVHKTFEGV